LPEPLSSLAVCEFAAVTLFPGAVVWLVALGTPAKQAPMKIAMTRESLNTNPSPRGPFVVKRYSLSGGSMLTANFKFEIIAHKFGLKGL
jgi:hypothetical protein